MTRTLTTLAALFIFSPVFAQDKGVVVGSGNTTTETRKLAEFDAIDLRISGDAHVTIGKQTPFEITGDDNILPLIKTEVHERRLVISAERNFKTKHSPDLKITVANLDAASIAGSGVLNDGTPPSAKRRRASSTCFSPIQHAMVGFLPSLAAWTTPFAASTTSPRRSSAPT